MHLDEERLQRLADGELSPAEEAAARAHLAVCGECRALFAEAEHAAGQSQALLSTLDQPMPRLDVEKVARLAREDATAEVPARDRTVLVPARKRPAPLRWAAAFALALAVVGAAYAIPGSPVRRWVENMIERERPVPGGPGLAIEPRNEGESPGIAMDPGRSFVVEFRANPSGFIDGKAVVRFTDDAELAIRVPIGGADFVSREDRVVALVSTDTVGFQIDVPRNAARVEMRLDGVPVFLKVGSQVTLAERVRDDTYRFMLKH